jgi:hypothetical protein
MAPFLQKITSHLKKITEQFDDDEVFEGDADGKGLDVGVVLALVVGLLGLLVGLDNLLDARREKGLQLLEGDRRKDPIVFDDHIVVESM